MPIYRLGVIIFLLTGLFAPLAEAQEKGDKKDQLAVQYYQDEEYEKALPLFEELFFNNRSSSYFYEYYLNTLLELEAYDQAIDMLQTQSENFDRLNYQVDLGYVYGLNDEEEKAAEVFDETIEELPANKTVIQTVANSFKNRGKLDRAIETYEAGRNRVNGDLTFSLQLARLNRQKEAYEASFQEYVNSLMADQQSQDLIKSELQELVMKPEPYETFKSELLSAIGSNPNMGRLIDMLSWLFIQNEDFNSAFIQLKALQKRHNTNGRRLINLAKVARKNHAFNTAESVYSYLKSLGEEHPFYYRARQGLLDVQYDRITKLGEYTQSDLRDLEQSYERFINDQRFSYNENGQVLLRLAEVKAEYSGKTDEAIQLLKDLTNKNLRGNRTLKARARLALGDYYLLKDDLWDAQLTYSKVEKMFEDHPLGHKAKFRNAKLSFYKGDFNWASSQLEILKGATSELIANNALELEMLIKDNRGLDTTEIPLQMYAKGDLYIFKNRFTKANQKLDSILQQFPDHNLTDEIYFAKARIAEKRNDFDTAVDFLKRVYTDYKKDILADNALYRAAKLYENKIQDEEKAKALYEKIILDHKASVFKIKARKHFRRLRGDAIN